MSDKTTLYLNQKNEKVAQGSIVKTLRWGLIVPNATVFIGSLCIMVLELTAGRLIARFLGSSLYTWTSVIGIVLSGIALGSYFGGRLADRFRPQQALAGLFFLASLSCAAIPLLNKIIGEGLIYLQLYWPAKILLHVSAIFLLPSILLGMISPIVAKWALDQGLRTGRTVGDIYAFSAVGSIVGTFLTGFFLIPLMGTFAIIGSISLVSGIIGFIFLIKGRVSPRLVLTFVLLVCVGLGLKAWAFGLRQPFSFFNPSKSGSNLFYEQESQYTYISVQAHPQAPDLRILKLDRLTHNKVNMRDPADISSKHQYEYIKLYGALTHLVAGKKTQLRTLFLGGGGYVIPRHIEKFWPGSHIEVVEIDPAVTEAAIQSLGLSRNNSLNIFHLDARNYIDDSLRKKQQEEKAGDFDIIYGDTINDVIVPFQLTTYEFNEKLRKLLAPEGIYMFNLVDAFSSGRFLGAQINTLKKTFPFIAVFSAGELRTEKNQRNTFILVCALGPIDFTELELASTFCKLLDASQLKLLEERSKGMILTDDYAPVENLLASVSREGGKLWSNNKLGVRLMEKGKSLIKKGRINEAIACYHKAISFNSSLAKEAYYNIALLLAWQGKLDETIAKYRQVLKITPDSEWARIALQETLEYKKGELSK